jgi:hypothetical protein
MVVLVWVVGYFNNIRVFCESKFTKQMRFALFLPLNQNYKWKNLQVPIILRLNNLFI